MKIAAAANTNRTTLLKQQSTLQRENIRHISTDKDAEKKEEAQRNKKNTTKRCSAGKTSPSPNKQMAVAQRSSAVLMLMFEGMEMEMEHVASKKEKLRCS